MSVALALSLLCPSQTANAIEINLNYVPDSPPYFDPTGSILMAHAKVASARWKELYPGVNATFDVDVSWTNEPGAYVTGYNCNVAVPKAGAYFVDPTPWTDEEFDELGRLSFEETSAAEQAFYFGDPPPDPLEVGACSAPLPASAADGWEADLLTGVMRGIEHCLLDFDVQPFLYPPVGYFTLYPTWVGGTSTTWVYDPSSSPFPDRLYGEPGDSRCVPSATEAMAVAKENGFNSVDLRRIDRFAGPNGFGWWDDALLWAGGQVPNFADEVTLDGVGEVTIGSDVTIDALTMANVDLTVEPGGSLEVKGRTELTESDLIGTNTTLQLGELWFEGKYPTTVKSLGGWLYADTIEKELGADSRITATWLSAQSMSGPAPWSGLLIDVEPHSATWMWGTPKLTNVSIYLDSASDLNFANGVPHLDHFHIIPSQYKDPSGIVRTIGDWVVFDAVYVHGGDWYVFDWDGWSQTRTDIHGYGSVYASRVWGLGEDGFSGQLHLYTADLRMWLPEPMVVKGKHGLVHLHKSRVCFDNKQSAICSDLVAGIAPRGFVLQEAGTLQGDGEVFGPVVNGGVVRPKSRYPSENPDALAQLDIITESLLDPVAYQQTQNGTLDVEVCNDTECVFDPPFAVWDIDKAGIVSLAGTLKVRAGSAVSVGEKYPVLFAEDAEIIGTFDTVVGPGGLIGFVADYSIPGEVWVEAVGTIDPGVPPEAKGVKPSDLDGREFNLRCRAGEACQEATSRLTDPVYVSATDDRNEDGYPVSVLSVWASKAAYEACGAVDPSFAAVARGGQEGPWTFGDACARGGNGWPDALLYAGLAEERGDALEARQRRSAVPGADGCAPEDVTFLTFRADGAGISVEVDEYAHSGCAGDEDAPPAYKTFEIDLLAAPARDAGTPPESTDPVWERFMATVHGRSYAMSCAGGDVYGCQDVLEWPYAYIRLGEASDGKHVALWYSEREYLACGAVDGAWVASAGCPLREGGTPFGLMVDLPVAAEGGDLVSVRSEEVAREGCGSTYEEEEVAFHLDPADALTVGAFFASTHSDPTVTSCADGTTNFATEFVLAMSPIDPASVPAMATQSAEWPPQGGTMVCEGDWCGWHGETPTATPFEPDGTYDPGHPPTAYQTANGTYRLDGPTWEWEGTAYPTWTYTPSAP